MCIHPVVSGHNGIYTQKVCWQCCVAWRVSFPKLVNFRMGVVKKWKLSIKTYASPFHLNLTVKVRKGITWRYFCGSVLRFSRRGCRVRVKYLNLMRLSLSLKLLVSWRGGFIWQVQMALALHSGSHAGLSRCVLLILCLPRFFTLTDNHLSISAGVYPLDLAPRVYLVDETNKAFTLTVHWTSAQEYHLPSLITLWPCSNCMFTVPSSGRWCLS